MKFQFILTLSVFLNGTYGQESFVRSRANLKGRGLANIFYPYDTAETKDLLTTQVIQLARQSVNDEAEKFEEALIAVMT